MDSMRGHPNAAERARRRLRALLSVAALTPVWARVSMAMSPELAFGWEGAMWPYALTAGVFVLAGAIPAILLGRRRLHQEARRRQAVEDALKESEARLEKLEASQAEALRRDKSRLSPILDTVADAILTFDEKGAIETANPAAARTFGHERSALIGQNVSLLMPDAFRDEAEESPRPDNIGDAPAGPGREAVARRADGTEFPAELSVTESEYDGRRRFTAVVRDISERKAAEKALRGSEERYRLLFERIPDAILISDPHTKRFFYVNPAACRLLGYSSEELLALNVPDIHPRESHARLLAEYEAAARVFRARFEEMPCLRKDGSVLYADISASPLTIEDWPLLVSILRDVTAQKKTREELVALTRDFIALLENTSDFIYLKDTEHRLTAASRSFARLVGYGDWKDLRGKTDFDLFPPEWAERRLGLEKAVLEEGRELLDHEEPYEDRRGNQGWMSSSIRPVRNPAGDIVGLFNIGHDNTERRRFIQQLEEAKQAADSANRSKSAFLANMSHEIRTPMNAILGFSQLMLHDAALTARQRERLDAINRSGEHLLALINDILEMSKIEAGRMTCNPGLVELPALTRDMDTMFRMRADAKNLQFALEPAPDLPRHIVTDESKLRQILINLVGNAMKFTEQGGIIWRIQTARAGDGERSLVCEVEDTGPGISAGDLGRLFKAFEQTETGVRTGGTGLGLAISRQFARMLGGDLTARSEVGRGSCFRLEIPLEESAEAPARPAARRAVGFRFTPGQAPPRALVADDRPENRTLLCEMLAGMGFETEEAADGAEAVSRFESGAFDLVMMDVTMPVMDGCEATRRIKTMERGARTPIIAVTASVFEEDLNRVRESGADGFLLKPFRESELLEAIRECLGLECVYEDMEEPDAGENAPPPDTLTPDSLQPLPPALLDQMRDATACGDLDRLLRLIERASETSPPLASRLRAMAEGFEYDALLALMGKDPDNG